jgi:hypothetical protein
MAEVVGHDWTSMQLQVLQTFTLVGLGCMGAHACKGRRC